MPADGNYVRQRLMQHSAEPSDFIFRQSTESSPRQTGQSGSSYGRQYQNSGGNVPPMQAYSQSYYSPLYPAQPVSPYQVSASYGQPPYKSRVETAEEEPASAVYFKLIGVEDGLLEVEVPYRSGQSLSHHILQVVDKHSNIFREKVVVEVTDSNGQKTTPHAFAVGGQTYLVIMSKKSNSLVYTPLQQLTRRINFVVEVLICDPKYKRRLKRCFYVHNNTTVKELKADVEKVSEISVGTVESFDQNTKTYCHCDDDEKMILNGLYRAEVQAEEQVTPSSYIRVVVGYQKTVDGLQTTIYKARLYLPPTASTPIGALIYNPHDGELTNCCRFLLYDNDFEEFVDVPRDTILGDMDRALIVCEEPRESFNRDAFEKLVTQISGIINTQTATTGNLGPFCTAQNVDSHTSSTESAPIRPLKRVTFTAVNEEHVIPPLSPPPRNENHMSVAKLEEVMGRCFAKFTGERSPLESSNGLGEFSEGECSDENEISTDRDTNIEYDQENEVCDEEEELAEDDAENMSEASYENEAESEVDGIHSSESERSETDSEVKAEPEDMTDDELNESDDQVVDDVKTSPALRTEFNQSGSTANSTQNESGLGQEAITDSNPEETDVNESNLCRQIDDGVESGGSEKQAEAPIQVVSDTDDDEFGHFFG